ncbi:SLBB domain-containing protein [Chitiniphilus purpureus]|uniref:SLBB domain-containing protein n=1 Tax=Chitiniphilus purpureus TaxID=2981137 RepID=A0ABY6DJH8_9NEIS|nr:SLBB domain-containing protein [Chitiniphilus sp. CD1]UXY14487.1 SLBB domain-containing protein [Chitiniphilus sp. CD1]
MKILNIVTAGFFLLMLQAGVAAAPTPCLSGTGDCPVVPAGQMEGAFPAQGAYAIPNLQQPLPWPPDATGVSRSHGAGLMRHDAEETPLSCDELNPTPVTPVPGGKVDTRWHGRTGMIQPGLADPQLLPKTPPVPRLTSFQRYLCQTTNKPLPVFGIAALRASGSRVPLEGGQVAPDYRLGVGDTFSLRIWGQLDADLALTVDRAGAVFIPRVGTVRVVGVSFGELKPYLQKEIGRVFRNFELAVTMGQLKSVQVFLAGQVKAPGSYALPALSTIVNALGAAGGIADTGSLRRITVKRGGRTVHTFDLYPLLLAGDKSGDWLLQPGDVVHVAAVGPQVAIYGGVKVPAIYELSDGESLAQLLDWAGGLDGSGLDGQLTVERVDRQKKRVVEQTTIEAAPGFKLAAGDVVQVYQLSQQVENLVILKGHVAQSLRMPWWEGMRVSDLIPSRQLVVDPQFWLGKRERTQEAGAGEDLTANQLLSKFSDPNNEVNWDYATIERVDSEYRSRLIPFNLAQALAGEPAQDVLLQPGDVVHIFSKAEIRVAGSSQTRYIRLEGEIAAPGVYEVEPGTTLRQLLERVGGLTGAAYLYGAEFTRESVKLEQRKQMDQLATFLEEAAQAQAVDTAQNALNAQDVPAAQVAAQQQIAAAKRIRETPTTGRIVLGLRAGARMVGDIPNVLLENGDRFYVPAIPGTVSVLGSVFSKNTAYLFDGKRELGEYIALAGGPTRTADESSLFVIRADGSVISNQQSTFGRVASLTALPGDTVVVPEKVDRKSFVRSLLDWTQILANFGTGAAAIKVLGD